MENHSPVDCLYMRDSLAFEPRRQRITGLSVSLCASLSPWFKNSQRVCHSNEGGI